MSNKPFEKPDCTKCTYQNNCPCGWSNCNAACLTTYKAKERNCGNCKWYAEYEGVCCNGDSEHRADFTDKNFYCKCHEYVEELRNEHSKSD